MKISKAMIHNVWQFKIIIKGDTYLMRLQSYAKFFNNNAEYIFGRFKYSPLSRPVMVTIFNLVYNYIQVINLKVLPSQAFGKYAVSRDGSS